MFVIRSQFCFLGSKAPALPALTIAKYATTARKNVAEGVGFEPTEHLAMLNGFQERWSSYCPVSSCVVLCCPVRGVIPSGVVLYHPVSSCSERFGLQLVCIQ